MPLPLLLHRMIVVGSLWSRWAFGCVLAVVEFSRLSLQDIVLYLGAIGLGLGTATGLGVAAYLSRVGRARAEAYKVLDEAQRDSTMGMLKHAVEERDEAKIHLLECVEQNEALRTDLGVVRDDLASVKGEVATIKSDLDSERSLSEKLRNDLYGYAMRVLRAKGYVAEVEPESGDMPVITLVDPAASDNHQPPDPG